MCCYVHNTSIQTHTQIPPFNHYMNIIYMYFLYALMFTTTTTTTTTTTNNNNNNNHVEYASKSDISNIRGDWNRLKKN